MKQKTFTKNQIDALVKNKNVSKFCGKYITYNKKFKVRAVNQYINEGMSPRGIFEHAGFDIAVIGSSAPGRLMHNWLNVFKTQGIDGLTKETRGTNSRSGGRPKIFETLTDTEKIKHLELEVQYLKKENDFLARLRAKRAE